MVNLFFILYFDFDKSLFSPESSSFRLGLGGSTPIGSQWQQCCKWQWSNWFLLILNDSFRLNFFNLLCPKFTLSIGGPQLVNYRIWPIVVRHFQWALEVENVQLWFFLSLESFRIEYADFVYEVDSVTVARFISLKSQFCWHVDRFKLWQVTCKTNKIVLLNSSSVFCCIRFFSSWSRL